MERRRAWLLLVMLAAVGCSSLPTSPPPPVVAAEGYAIQPGDTLRFLLLAAPDRPPSPLDLVVQPDGIVMVPYLGAVRAGGRTAGELLQEVRRRLARLFTTPVVPHVSIAVYPSRLVQVLGEVRDPGSFPLVPGMRASDALARAGGLARPRAAANGALLLRRGAADHVFPVRFADILGRGDRRTDYLLEPGDTIYVPPTGFRKVAYFIEDLLAPLHALVSPFVAPASVVVAERSVRVVQ